MKTLTNRRYLRYLNDTERVVKENKKRLSTCNCRLDFHVQFLIVSRGGLTRFKPKTDIKTDNVKQTGFNSIRFLRRDDVGCSI